MSALEVDGGGGACGGFDRADTAGVAGDVCDRAEDDGGEDAENYYDDKDLDEGEGAAWAWMGGGGMGSLGEASDSAGRASKGIRAAEGERVGVVVIMVAGWGGDMPTEAGLPRGEGCPRREDLADWVGEVI